MANKAFGTLLYMAGTALGEILSVDAPEVTTNFVETTHHNLSDPWRTFIPTILEGGEVGVTVNTTTTGYAAVDAIQSALSSTPTAFRIDFTGGIKLYFSGYIMSQQIDQAEFDGKLTTNIKIKITGKIVQTIT